MNFRRRDLLKLTGSSAAVLSAPDLLAARPVLRRDVCIIGGGAAGTYAAVRLRDQGRSVAIIERSGRLGGHAETFYDPNTGAPIDIGVIVFPDNSLVRNYFGRFNVPLASLPQRGGRSASVDFRTGSPVAAYQPSPDELGAALFAYLQLVTGPFAFVAANGYQLPSSGPLLDQLVQPFGTFVERNGLKALLPLFFLYEQGFGPLLDVPTLYVLKNMGPDVVGGILSGSFVAVPSGTSSLYESATAELGSDVVFRANVTKVVRPARGPVVVLAETDSGPRVIQADKLLVTAPPVLENFCAFDLDRTETRLFGRFEPNFYWTGVVRTNGLPPDLSIVNVSPDTPANLARLPGIYSASPSAVPGLTNVKYGSAVKLEDREVRRAIRADLERVRLPEAGPIEVDGFAIFKSHSPYALMASRADIRGGFYAALQDLQGHRRTYYASATFQTHSSAAIWAFIEELLPKLSA